MIGPAWLWRGENARQAWRFPPLDPLELRVRLSGLDAVCRMVESGVGVAIMPEAAARRSAGTAAIRSVPLSDAWALRHLAICARSVSALPAHAQHLVRHLAGGD